MANPNVFSIVNVILIISHLNQINAADLPCFPQIAEPSCKIIGEQVVDCVVNLRCDYKVTIFNELEPISTTRKCIENWITECSVASHANPLIRCIDKSYLTSKKYATYGVGAPCKNYFGLDGICALLLNCPSGAIEYASQINNHVYSQYIQDSNCNTETEFSICCAPEISLVQGKVQSANTIPAKYKQPSSIKQSGIQSGANSIFFLPVKRAVNRKFNCC